MQREEKQEKLDHNRTVESTNPNHPATTKIMAFQKSNRVVVCRRTQAEICRNLTYKQKSQVYIIDLNFVAPALYSMRGAAQILTMVIDIIYMKN